MNCSTDYFSGFSDPKDIQHTRIAEEAKDLDTHPADDVCHDEQIAIWADDLIEALAQEGRLVEPETYGDKIAVARIVREEIRTIVRSAFDLSRSEKALADIEEMIAGGQGDDDGPTILPDFDEGMSTVAKVEACLHLLESRRDTIAVYGETEAAS